MTPQEKLLSEQKRNDQEFTQKQKTQEVKEARTTLNVIEDKESNSSVQGLINSLYFSDDWDKWYPDPSN